MELRKNQNNKFRNLNNREEKSRILRQYAVIFPDNINEFANTFIKKLAKRKNFSK